jgi:hypothetical protein
MELQWISIVVHYASKSESISRGRPLKLKRRQGISLPSPSPRKRYRFFDGLQGLNVCTIAVRLRSGDCAALTGMNLPVIAERPICLVFIATTSLPGRLARCLSGCVRLGRRSYGRRIR